MASSSARGPAATLPLFSVDASERRGLLAAERREQAQARAHEALTLELDRLHRMFESASEGVARVASGRTKALQARRAQSQIASSEPSSIDPLLTTSVETSNFLHSRGIEARRIRAGNTLIDGIDGGYAPPTWTEIFPAFLLSKRAMEYLDKNQEHYVFWNTRSLYHWAMGLTVSRTMTDLAINTVSGFNGDTEALPFDAVWDKENQMPAPTVADASNAPLPTWVPTLNNPRSDILMPWLGCRCSWPTSQLCWWNCMACGCYQFVALTWVTLTIIFESVLLDAILMQDYVAQVPNRVTPWASYLTSNQPMAVKIATVFIYLILPLFVVGFIWGAGGAFGIIERQGNIFSYYPSLYQNRILLRSLAARKESNTYAYCTTVYWAILIEIETVIIPGYLPFVAPNIIMAYYDGNLYLISKMYVVWAILIAFRPEHVDATTDFVAGKRAVREWYVMQYVYLWTMLVVMLLITILCKWRLSLLYLWLVPATVVVYAVAVHTIPYWMNGISVCPPHTGAAVEMAGIATVILYLIFFMIARACFLFPCLCAPEIPGWLFFPPDNPPPNPLQGDIDLGANIIFLRKLLNGFPNLGENCVWTVPDKPTISNIEWLGPDVELQLSS